MIIKPLTITLSVLGCAQGQAVLRPGNAYFAHAAAQELWQNFINIGPKVTHKAWFDVAVETETETRLIDRIEIGLFGEAVPKTVENFINLATAAKEAGYNGTSVDLVKQKNHVSNNFFLQWAGDMDWDKSSFGERFPDENYDVRAYGAGWVVMDNGFGGRAWSRGIDGRTTGSAFMMFLRSYDNKKMVGRATTFGKVLHGGMKHVREIEKALDGPFYFKSMVQWFYFEPRPKVYIAACGAEKVAKPFRVSNKPKQPKEQPFADRVRPLTSKGEPIPMGVTYTLPSHLAALIGN